MKQAQGSLHKGIRNANNNSKGSKIKDQKKDYRYSILDVKRDTPTPLASTSTTNDPEIHLHIGPDPDVGTFQRIWVEWVWGFSIMQVLPTFFAVDPGSMFFGPLVIVFLPFSLAEAFVS